MNMKKSAAVIAAGMVLACMPMTAMADVSLESLGTMENVEWVSGTNLLQTEGSEGYGIATIDGTALTEQIYGRLYGENGYITAYTAESGLNTEGLLSQEGTELMPLQYGDIDVLSGKWALGFVLEDADANQYDYTSLWGEDAYYLIKTVDVYYIEDGAATCVASLAREEYMSASEAGKYINIENRSTGTVTTYDSAFNEVATDVGLYDEPEDARDLMEFREDGRYGLKDAEGNIVMEASYYLIYDFDGGYARVATEEDQRGLIDEEGNLIVPMEYEDVVSSYYAPVDENGDTVGYNCYGYFAVEKDGKLGWVDESGAVTCEPKYSADVAESYGASALITDLEGNTILQAADGAENVLEGYESIYAMSYGSGMFYEVRDADYNCGMIDWHGNEILPCTYSDIELSGDGMYVMAESGENYGTWELYRINVSGGQDAGDSADAETEAAAEEAATEAAAE